KQALNRAVDDAPPVVSSPFPEPLQKELADLQSFLTNGEAGPPRYLVERLLLDVGGYLDKAKLPSLHRDGLAERLAAARARLADAGCPAPAVEAMARYRWVGQILEGVVSQSGERKVTW